MKLRQKETFGNEWIEHPNLDFKYKIDYLTIEQDEFINALLSTALSESKNDKNEAERQVFSLFNSSKATRYYIKFAVKDWQGIEDSEGNQIRCRVVNNELDDKQWDDLCETLTSNADGVRDITNLNLNIMFGQIWERIGFNATDKKKLQSAETSTTKVNLPENGKNTQLKSETNGTSKTTS